MKRVIKVLCLALCVCTLLSGVSTVAVGTANYAIQGLSVQSNTVQVQVFSEDDCLLLVALYESSGKLMTVGTETVTGDTAVQTVQVPLPVDSAGHHKAAAFLVNSATHAPLCESFSRTALELEIDKLELPDTWKQELGHAAELGFSMDKLRQETVSGKELAALLDELVAYANEEKLPAWQAQVPELREYEGTLTRFDAMAALYLAAQTLGGGWAEFKANFGGTLDSLQFPWDHYYFTDGLYSSIDGPKFEVPGRGLQYLDGVSLSYNFSRPSGFSGEFPFAYDVAENSIHEFDAPTYAECLLAVVRLVASEQPDRFGTISAAQADSGILTPELIEKSNANPEVTAEDHPVWTGFVLGWDPDVYASASVDNIEHIANWGFNSVRIMIDYRNLFDEEDVSIGNHANLRVLDSFVAAAIEHDLHLNICLCKLPGRCAVVDPDTYTSTGEFDLFINEEKQEQVDAIWAMLSERYREVPSANLSFTPFWEALNKNLSTGLPFKDYTPEDVGAYLVQVVDVIREKDEDRLIIYEPTANNLSEQIIKESTPIKEAVSDKENILISYNFCEQAYVYAAMTATEGEHIDNNNHSIPMPGYPTCYYAAHDYVDSYNPLTLDGFLPAGTVIDLYLDESAEGTLSVTVDEQVLTSEVLETAQYDVGHSLSRYYLYASSDKKISVTLPEPAELVTIATTGSFRWSGMDVTLPEEYAIDQWWYITPYDVFLGVEEQEGMVQKHTSRIIISPTSGWGSRKITIRENVSYFTGEICEQSNKMTINQWCSDIDKFDGNCIIRIEPAEFSGAVWEDVKAYYMDILDAYTVHGYSWWSNEFWLMTNEYPQTVVVAECPSEVKYGFTHFNLELLELLQKYSGTISSLN